MLNWIEPMDVSSMIVDVKTRSLKWVGSAWLLKLGLSSFVVFTLLDHEQQTLYKVSSCTSIVVKIRIFRPINGTTGCPRVLHVNRV